MKNHVIPTFIAAVIAITGLNSCGLKKEKIVEAPPVKVTVLPVTANSIGSERTYTGTVTTGDGAEVSFTIPGTVKKIYVTEGQTVNKGQLLAELKDDNLINAYNIAKATLDEAQDAYNRFKQLHDANALADIRWVEVENTLKQAQNAEQVAARAVTDAKAYAPVSGIVAKKSIDVGQTVVPAVPVISIVALGDVRVSIPVPETEIAAMADGQKAKVTVQALDNLELEGTLTEKGVVANPLTRAYDVKFSVDNKSGRLLPGMICSVKLEGGTSATSAPAIVLPSQAVLLSADNRNFVWVADNGKASQRFITASDITAEGIVVSKGLAAGDSVIVAGMQKVSEGTEIEPE